MCWWRRGDSDKHAARIRPCLQLHKRKSLVLSRKCWRLQGRVEENQSIGKCSFESAKSINDACPLVVIMLLCELWITSVVDELINSKMIHPSLAHNNPRVTESLVALQSPVQLLHDIRNPYSTVLVGLEMKMSLEIRRIPLFHGN